MTLTRVLTRFAFAREFKGEPADQIELTHEQREKSRFRATTHSGREVSVLLPRGANLRGNTVLVGGDEEIGKRGVLVLAAREPVVRATVHTPLELAKLAYHLGNRHTPVQLLEPEESDHGTHYALQFKPDDVLAEMAERLGGHVHGMVAAFEPEGGAYSGEAQHQGHHGHHHAPVQQHIDDHNHDHDDAHDHAHDHAHDDAPGHVHTAACGHDHAHESAHGHAHDHAHDRAHEHAPPAELPAQREDPVHVVRIHRPGKAPVERVIRGPGHHD